MLDVRANHLGAIGSDRTSDGPLSHRQYHTVGDCLRDLWTLPIKLGLQPVLELRQHFTVHQVRAVQRPCSSVS